MPQIFFAPQPFTEIIVYTWGVYLKPVLTDVGIHFSQIVPSGLRYPTGAGFGKPGKSNEH